MKHILKRLLYTVAPQWTTALISSRSRAHSHKVIANWGSGPVTRKLIERYGNSVQEGHFAGLILTAMTHAEQLGPYLLGVYESELDQAWTTVFRGSYTQIIDIGAKFGYYAVGLAKKFPDATVVAFDTDWWARKAIREMSATNRTSNVQAKGFCHSDWVARHIQKAAFVISDCEGYEAVLFGPDTISKLRSATLIIETHDNFVPGVSDRLRMAFGETHTVRVIASGGGQRATTRPLGFLSGRERQLAVQEVRSLQSWLLCLPNTGPNKALQLTGEAISNSEG